MPATIVYCPQCRRDMPGPLRHLQGGYDVCPSCYTRSNCFVCSECHGSFMGYDRHDGSDLCYNCHYRAACWEAEPITFDGKITELKSSRRFGIELETEECPGHFSLRGKTAYGSKYDGSISGMEFVSPILQGDKGLWATRGFCTRAKNKGFKVDGDCGYHLHIDVSSNTDLQRRHIACAYAYTHSFWCSLVASHRAYDSSYCRPLDWDAERMVTTYNMQRFCDNQERYVWFNVHSLERHGTFEIRLHEGTLDSRRICNWVKANLRFADFVQDMKFREIASMFHVNGNQMVRAVMDTWDDPALRRYFKKVARRAVYA